MVACRGILAQQTKWIEPELRITSSHAVNDNQQQRQQTGLPALSHGSHASCSSKQLPRSHVENDKTMKDITICTCPSAKRWPGWKGRRPLWAAAGEMRRRRTRRPRRPPARRSLGTTAATCRWREEQCSVGLIARSGTLWGGWAECSAAGFTRPKVMPKLSTRLLF